MRREESRQIVSGAGQENWLDQSPEDDSRRSGS